MFSREKGHIPENIDKCWTKQMYVVIGVFRLIGVISVDSGPLHWTCCHYSRELMPLGDRFVNRGS